MSIIRARMFAGPNGSGKSELIADLKETDLPLGPVVNADIIFSNLQNAGFIDLTEYCLKEVKQKNWDNSLKDKTELSSRIQKAGIVPQIKIVDDILICEQESLGTYTAALIADFIRYMLAETKKSFSFETVMSHPGKIDFLKLLKSKRYKTYLYFIATDDYNINISRVKNRVRKGGHDVPEDKIINRYKRSLNLLHEALNASDRVYILDSSNRKSFVIFEKKNDGKGYAKVDNYPQWFEKSVIEKLENSE